MPSRNELDDPPRESTVARSPSHVVPFLVLSDDSQWVTRGALREDHAIAEFSELLAGWARHPRRILTPSMSFPWRGTRALRARQGMESEVRRSHRLANFVSSTLNVSRLAGSYVRGATTSATGARAAVPSRCLFESGQWDCTGESCPHLASRLSASDGGGDVGTSTNSLDQASGDREGLT